MRRATGHIPETVFDDETRDGLRHLLGAPAVGARDALAAEYVGVWQGTDEGTGADLAAARAWLRQAAAVATRLDRLATAYDALAESARDRVHEAFARARHNGLRPQALRQARDRLSGALPPPTRAAA